MTRPLLILAVACSLVLGGCLGGGFETAVGGNSDATETTATETTAAETTRDSVPEHDQYDSYESLAESAPFSVPDPDVPDHFAFQSALVMTIDNSTHVAIAYHDAADEPQNVLSVRKAESGSLYRESDGNETTVGDREARYVIDDGTRQLIWECGGYSYRVSVQQFDDGFGEESLRSVAESVGCE